MSRQREATGRCKTVLEPLLRDAGFEGEFPFFLRRGKQCIECVTISVFVRGGVQLSLGSVNLAPVRSARAISLLLARHPPPPEARSTWLTGHWPIDSASDLRALERGLGEVPARLRVEGRRFWAKHPADLVFRARLREVAAAAQAFDPARLRRVLASMPEKEAQRCLDHARVDRWHDPKTIRRAAPLASELLRWRAPWLLGALVTTSVIRQETAERTAVLAWARRHLARESFAEQLATFADQLLSTDLRAARTLFELCAPSGRLARPQWGNALFAMLSSDHGGPVEPARQRRLIKRALEHASDDPTVHFNVACLLVELGDPPRATEHLLTALALGASNEHVKQDPSLTALLEDPRVVKALRTQRPARPPAQARLRTHGAPTLGLR